MCTLRAEVRVDGSGWWEAKLLDLAIMADGSSEQEMLAELTRAITFEYHVAIRRGETPFASLRHAGTDGSFSNAEINLSLPPHVSRALTVASPNPRVQ